MNLANDIARCRGYNHHASLPFSVICDRRQHCARYVQGVYRDKPGTRVVYSRHSHDPAKECRSFIAEAPKLSR